MASSADQRAWLEGLEEGWRRELAASRREIEKIWNTPLPERVLEGHSVASLRVVKAAKDRVILAAPSDADCGDCRLREGDFVCLSHDSPWSPEGKFIHLGEDDHGIHLALWRGTLPAEGSSDWVMDRDFVDLTDRYAAATEALAHSELGRGRILPLLAGETEVEADGGIFNAVAEDLESEVNDPLWHDSQKLAITSCMATHDAWLVQGPPGTGKTHVLAEVVRRLTERGERVLVTGPTHRAIAHALDACRRVVSPAVRVVKIGPSMASHGSFESFEDYTESGLIDSTDPHVVGATPFALWSSYTGLRETMFDTVVIDEASQVTVMVAAMAMLHGERWLFFGDHYQLPPIVLDPRGGPARERSIFSLLRNRDFDSMLEETWRLNRELAEWPSATFYRNRLVCRHDRKLTLTPPPQDPALLASASVVLETHQETGKSVRCETEAQRVVDLVRSLVDGGVAPDDIGVITPFRAQAARIREVLRIAWAGTGLNHSIVVDTVERFQGQEREVIVISLVSSKPAWIRRMAGFLFQPERWNVAITRARRKLVVIASDHLLEIAETLADEGDEGAVCFSSWRKNLAADAIIPS